MLLRNKKTGEVVEPVGISIINGRYFIRFEDERGIFKYECRSLTELNNEWEDYEEPKEYWYVSCDGRALKATTDEDDYNEKHTAGHKEIGNHFETKEEAEKAVEKLKAWKRLKDKGFRFIPEASYVEEQPKETGESMMLIACTMNDDKDFIYGDNKDLKLLFLS